MILLVAAASALTPSFAGEVARIAFESTEEEHKTKENMAKATLTKVMTLANELNARGERRRILQLHEQELFAQWHKLELQAKDMMEELGENASFVPDTRKSLDDAKRERSWQVARAEEIDQQRRGLMERRRGLIQARALIASTLEELTGNLTVLDAAKQKALQAAAQQTDAVAQEEAQLASIEHVSSKARRRATSAPVHTSSTPRPHCVRTAFALRSHPRRTPRHALYRSARSCGTSTCACTRCRTASTRRSPRPEACTERVNFRGCPCSSGLQHRHPAQRRQIGRLAKRPAQWPAQRQAPRPRRPPRRLHLRLELLTDWFEGSHPRRDGSNAQPQQAER